MRLRAAAEVVGVDTVVDTAEVSVVALIWAAVSAALTSADSAAALTSGALAMSAVLAPLWLAVLRVTTSPRPVATSAAKGICAAGVSRRAGERRTDTMPTAAIMIRR